MQSITVYGREVIWHSQMAFYDPPPLVRGRRNASNDKLYRAILDIAEDFRATHAGTSDEDKWGVVVDWRDQWDEGVDELGASVGKMAITKRLRKRRDALARWIKKSEDYNEHDYEQRVEAGIWMIRYKNSGRPSTTSSTETQSTDSSTNTWESATNVLIDGESSPDGSPSDSPTLSTGSSSTTPTESSPTGECAYTPIPEDQKWDNLEVEIQVE